MVKNKLTVSNHHKGVSGEEIAFKFFKKLGYMVEKRQKGDKGFDLRISKKGVTETVEVKTTKNMRGGIPDMHNTEFKKGKGGHWYFVANYLCIIRMNGKVIKQIDLVSRHEVDDFAPTHKTKIGIRTTSLDTALKNRKTGKFYSRNFKLIE